VGQNYFIWDGILCAVVSPDTFSRNGSALDGSLRRSPFQISAHCPQDERSLLSARQQLQIYSPFDPSSFDPSSFDRDSFDRDSFDRDSQRSAQHLHSATFARGPRVNKTNNDASPASIGLKDHLEQPSTTPSSRIGARYAQFRTAASHLCFGKFNASDRVDRYDDLGYFNETFERSPMSELTAGHYSLRFPERVI
jgi:hypothetical protein